MYERDFVETLVNRIGEPRSFIQIVMGPRQTGKSTAVGQALERIGLPRVEHIFRKADVGNVQMLEDVWVQARRLAQEQETAIVLSLDEVQEVSQWSSHVKSLWDEDTREKRDVRVIATGSSSLLLKKGLQEALTGRFEVIRSTHWGFGECIEAFDYTLSDFLYFGGYPGAAKLRADEGRWFDYMWDSVIEPTLSIDVIEMEDIRRPALMRALFELGAAYSSQELSYRKILGQFDDKGNTATIASYLSHLSNAGLVSGLQKYSDKLIETKSSSPRLLAHDTSLMVAASAQDRSMLLSDPAKKGRLVETAVGAYLLARAQKEHFDVYWWRESNKEVDFVVRKGTKRSAIEVKSGRVKRRGGLAAFLDQYPGTYCLTVGSEDCPLEAFLLGEVPVFQ